MQHRVALLGNAKWRSSPQVLGLRVDRRITTIVARGFGTPPPSRPPDGAIAIVQLAGISHQTLAAIEWMSRPSHTIRCIAVTRSLDEYHVRACVEANVWGMILESADTRELMAAIHAVGAGRLTYPQNVIDSIVTHRGHMSLAPPPSEPPRD